MLMAQTRVLVIVAVILMVVLLNENYIGRNQSTAASVVL